MCQLRPRPAQYFGEKFAASQCHATCDNCRARAEYDCVTTDMTRHAQALLALVEEGRKQLTLRQLADAYRGTGRAASGRMRLNMLRHYGEGPPRAGEGGRGGRLRTRFALADKVAFMACPVPVTNQVDPIAEADDVGAKID